MFLDITDMLSGHGIFNNDAVAWEGHRAFMPAIVGVLFAGGRARGIADVAILATPDKMAMS